MKEKKTHKNKKIAVNQHKLEKRVRVNLSIE
jgi:hypothetical protein